MPGLSKLVVRFASYNRVRRLRIGGTVLGVLVILTFAASSGYDGWRAYDNARSATQREIDNESKTLAEQTALSFQGVDLLREDTVRWYRTDGLRMPPERV